MLSLVGCLVEQQQAKTVIAPPRRFKSEEMDTKDFSWKAGSGIKPAVLFGVEKLRTIVSLNTSVRKGKL